MRLLLPLSFAALLIAAGCSKDKDVEPPAKLVNFPTTLPVKKLWSEGVGGGKKQIKLRLGLGPAIDNGLVFAASHKGEVIAVALDTGRNVWVKKLKVPISAGPAAGSGIVVAGQQQGGGHCVGRRHRPAAVALAGQFGTPVLSCHQRKRRGDTLRRRPTARSRNAHRGSSYGPSSSRSRA